MVNRKTYELMFANIGGEEIIESNKVKLSGINIDSGLTFNEHLNSIFKEASNTLNALWRQCAILPFQKRRIMMHVFITSQFNYCPLVWMCHSRAMNNKINNLQYSVFFLRATFQLFLLYFLIVFVLSCFVLSFYVFFNLLISVAIFPSFFHHDDRTHF